MSGPLEGLERWFKNLAAPEVGLELTESPIYDAFARLRTSSPKTLFDSTQEYNEQPLLWYDSYTGTASIVFSTDEPASLLSVSQGNAQVARQSKRYTRYQPGKSQLILMTFVTHPYTTEDVHTRVGYFEPSDGILFELDASTPYFVRRYTTVDGAIHEERVAQSAWTVDRLDGTQNSRHNPSEYNLDLTKSQILYIDLEWLGVGRVRVGFVIDGHPVVCHTFNASNESPTVYMASANLPVRYELESGPDVTGTFTLKQICCQVASEGGFEEEAGFQFEASLGIVLRSVESRIPILSIRPKATFGGKVNRAVIIPDSFEFYAEDQPTFFEVVYGGVLTSGSFASFSDYSVVEVDKSATAIAGGIVVGTKYVPANERANARIIGADASEQAMRLPLALHIDGSHPTGTPSDVLTICATTMNAQNATDTGASIGWLELR